MKYELAIAHRVCPVLAKTASHFADKFKMVEATTDSLVRALKGIRTKLFVILDGCPKEYEAIFKSKFSDMSYVDCEIILTQAIGNHQTYSKQITLLSSVVNDAEFLYFSEDDYIYKPEAFRAMMDFLRNGRFDFVTPLDHPDKYDIYRWRPILSSEIRVSNYCHWRDVDSTCCTFMSKSATFLRAKRSLAYYAEGGSDFLMWLLLTKKGCYSLGYVLSGVLQYIIGRPRNWMSLIPMLAWFRFGPKLIFAPRFRLWSPVPSLAVHLCVPSLPPFSDRLI